MIRALVWKEYREQRSVWIAMTVLTIFLLMMMPTVATRSAGDWIVYMAVIMTVGHGVLCGSLLFAGERESRTLSFLDVLTAHRSRLWRGKVIGGMALTLAQAVAVGAVVAVLRLSIDNRNGLFRTPRYEDLIFTSLVLAVLALDGFIWGLLFSATSGQVLTSVGLALLSLLVSWPVTSVVVGIIAFLFGRSPSGEESNLLTVLVCVRLNVSGAALCLSHYFFCQRDRERAYGVGWGNAWRALLWLSRRQGLLWVAGVGLPVLGLGYLLPTSGFVIWPLVTLLIGVWCGLGCFAGDQAWRGQQFLGNQRLGAGRIWLGKSAVWLAAGTSLACLLLLGGFLRIILAGKFRPGLEGEMRTTEVMPDVMHIEVLDSFTNPAVFLTMWLVYGFSIGQIFGLLVRKTVVGLVLSVSISAMLVSFWVPSLLCGGLRLWQVLAVPVLLLVTTRLVTWNWLTNTLTARKPVVLLVGVPVLAALWIVGNLWYRAHEIKDVGPPFDLAAYEAAAPTTEQNKGWRLIRGAVEEMVQRQKLLKGESGQHPQAQASKFESSHFIQNRLLPVLRNGWPKGNKDLAKWMDDMFKGDLTKKLQEASILPLGVADDGRGALYFLSECEALGMLLTGRALQLQARGESGPALDHLVWALTISRTLRNRALTIMYQGGQSIESETFRALESWLAHVGPKPEVLHKALDEVTRHEDEIPPASEILKAEFAAVHNRLDHPSGQFLKEQWERPPNALDGLQADLRAWAYYVPWERERAARILNICFQARSGHTTFVEFSRLLPNHLSPYVFMHLSINDSSHRSSLPLCKIRAFRLRLALALYEIEKKAPAAGLDDLVKAKYLKSVPLDPYSNWPFGYRVSKGEKIPIVLEETGTVSKGKKERDKFMDVGPGQGIIWSTGPDRKNDGGKKQGIDYGFLALDWYQLGLDLIFLVPRWPKP